MPPPLIQLTGIALTFGGTPLLQSADLSVSAGERVCLVGRNGSGKSTLLKIAAGLVEPDNGTRFVQPGVSMRYLPQEPDLSAHATTLSYVEEGLNPGDDSHAARYLLEQLGLTGEENPSRLSGGEARRAALARALAPRPALLLCDEPVAALDLDGSKVCVQTGTTSQLNLADYFRTNNMKYQEVKFAKPEEMRAAYDSGQCDTLTADVSRLHAERLALAKPDDQIILPDVISKEPLAAAVRQKDDGWLLIVKWTVYAMLNAEELGINSKNIDEALKSNKPEVKRFVGTEGAYGEQIGLSKDWAVRIIRHVGNYGEVFDRNVGTGTKLNIPRGLNQLWSDGGIQYAPPIR